VRSAGHPAEAIAVGREFHPDILIADWLLTDVDSGLAVAEQLREFDPSLRILFFTGLPTHKLEIEAQHLRPFRFLEKPCEFDTLRAAIRDVVADLQLPPKTASTN